MNDPGRRRILVADDEESMRHFLRRALQREGFEVEVVDNGEDAVERWKARRPHAGLLDLMMPGMDGLEALGQIRELDPDAVLVMMTGHATISSAVEAMRRGAADYVTKPLELDEVLLVIERALQQRATLEEVRSLRHLIDNRSEQGGLIGQSSAMRQIFQTLDQLRGSEATVLLEGESGTGKELVARALHGNSRRAGGPFVPLHCAALPDSLLENELFGHVSGAFTGAREHKCGLLERAEGGTLFVDEVAEISPPSQVKLARFLQERRFVPLGASEAHEVDLRVIAASNRDLEQAVEAGSFREELYWQLNVVPVRLAPLRERKEDIPLLAHHFLERFRSQGKTRALSISLDVGMALAVHDWPGNVRELQNTLERMAVMHAEREILDLDCLPPELHQGTAGPTRATPSDLRSLPFPQALRAFECQYFERLLERAAGNVSEAARIGEISRPQLHRKIKQLGLSPGGHRG